MEELRGHKNTVPLMSLTFGENGNDVSHSPEDDLHQQYIMAARRNKTHPVPLPLPQWIHCQQTSHHYVKFLTGSGVSDIQREREVSHNLGMVPIFKPAELSLDMDARKVEPYAKMLNSSHQEASINLAGTLCSGQIEIKDGERCSVPMVRYLRSHNEGRPVNNFTSAEYQTRLQKQESNEDYCNVSQPHSRVAVAAPGFPPKPRKNVARQRATDRRRRLRIAEKLDTLQELLPHSKEGGKASVLDDVIDHIKYLQLQIKLPECRVLRIVRNPRELVLFHNVDFLSVNQFKGNLQPMDLSRSRLEGESTSDPFICLEGYGHYLLHEQMLSEPLEEVVGKLLEMNPSAATQLLESRGLFMMPATLAEGLHQTI